MATITRTSADSKQKAGRATRIALINGPTSGHVTTGVRTNEGELRLIEWAVTENSVERGNEGRFARDTTEIAIATRAGAFVSTALRADGSLKIVNWDSGFLPIGDSDSQAGRATQVTICRLDVIAEPPRRVGGLATAVRDSDGDLKVIGWTVTEEGRVIDRFADSRQQAGEAKEVSISGGGRAEGGNLVVTAVKTNENRLKLIAWLVPSTGDLIARRGDSDDRDEIDDVVVVGGERAVTAIRTDKGNLQLITWRVAPNGSEIQRISDSGTQAGSASKIALAPFGRDHYVTAMRNGEGDLELIAWQVSRDGRRITRVADSRGQAGAVSEVTLAEVRNGFFVTAVRDSDGRLRVIGWKVKI